MLTSAQAGQRIAQVPAGLGIYTEHETASGRAPVQTVNGKVRDGLVVHDGGQVRWLGIENSWKNRTRRQAIVDLATRHLGRDKLTQVGGDGTGDILYLTHVVVVATGRDALRSMAGTFAKAHRLLIASEAAWAMLTSSSCRFPPVLYRGK